MYRHRTQWKIDDCEEEGDDNKPPLVALRFGLLKSFDGIVAIAVNRGSIEVVEQGKPNPSEHSQECERLHNDWCKIQREHIRSNSRLDICREAAWILRTWSQEITAAMYSLCSSDPLELKEIREQRG